MNDYRSEKIPLISNMSTENRELSLNIHTNKNEECTEKFTTYGVFIVSSYIILFFARIILIGNANFVDNVINNFPSTEIFIKDEHKTMSYYCLSKGKPCLAAYRNIQEDFVRKFIVAPKYKMANCIMPKCMSTVTSKIFSYLYDTEEYLKFNWQMNGVSASHHKNDFSKMENFINKFVNSNKNNLKDWQLSVFIREPLDRFISAFIDKCYLEKDILSLGMFYPGSELCYGCNKNMSCYLTKQYTRSALYSRSLQRVVGYEDQHTFPQNWFCSFGDYKNIYTVYKTKTDKEGKIMYKNTIIDMLKKQNVEEDKIEYIEKFILQNRKNITDPIEVKLKEKKKTIKNYNELPTILKNELLSDPYMYKLFISMYYYDYLIFDYPIPLPKFKK
uniref:Carbohydrate sulfotransferase n=1 Tax=Strongyloides venezuelensis TaxID=75913 RepID=A0A0K0EWI3_STRVS